MEKQLWIFTFGSGQKHGGHFVKIYGTFEEARSEMIAKYGTEWGFQYTEEEWNDYVKEAEDFAVRVWGDKRFALVEKELV